MAWRIFLNTRQYFHLNFNHFPMGIVAGTFELSAHFWYLRNVIGRLIAVALGASDLEVKNGTELYQVYDSACHEMGFDWTLCKRYAKPSFSGKHYRRKWRLAKNQWRSAICDRLVQITPVRKFKYSNLNRPKALAHQYNESHKLSYRGPKVIRQNLFKLLPESGPLAMLRNRLVSHTGVIWDMVASFESADRLNLLVRQLHSLGFSMLQMRLANDHGFAALLNSTPHLVEPFSSPDYGTSSAESIGTYELLVRRAAAFVSICVNMRSKLSCSTADRLEIFAHTLSPRVWK